MEQKKKIIIAAGGTGGHLYPGISLAQEFSQAGYIPEFIIRTNDPSENIIKKEGFGFHYMPVAPFPRGLTLKYFSFLFMLLRGFIKGYSIIRDISPSAIIGMGGYISFPAVILGRMLGIPTFIHEQNFLPGLANRMLSKFCDKVAISFEESAKYFPRNKTVYTGNPIRPGIFGIDPETAFEELRLSSEKFTVLVFGGSLGAKKINTTVTDILPGIKDLKEHLQFIHITGKNDLDRVAKKYEDAGFYSRIFPYMHNIGIAYAAADLIICRAGATTISELKVLAKTAILVPYPFATDNHQDFNALSLVSRGNAIVIKDNQFTKEFLLEEIRKRTASFTPLRQTTPFPIELPQKVIVQKVLSLLS